MSETESKKVSVDLTFNLDELLKESSEDEKEVELDDLSQYLEDNLSVTCKTK